MGLGYLNRGRLLQKMHAFHSKKLVQTFEATEMNRIRKKKRQTLSRESNLNQIIKDFDCKNMVEKVESLNYFLLDIGTYTSSKLDPTYFDLLPPLTDIELNPDQQPIFTENSFLDQSSISDIPDLEELPDQSEVPSFLYYPPAQRDCTRKLRSTRTNSRVHPFSM